MTQTGRVLDVSDKGITISVVRETACGESCASCSAKCSLQNQTVCAEYMSGIKMGDTVIFEMPASKVLFAAFIVYITPLLVLIAVYIGASSFVSTEMSAVLIGVVAMAVWFVIIHFLDKLLQGRYKHNIIKKIEGES